MCNECTNCGCQCREVGDLLNDMAKVLETSTIKFGPRDCNNSCNDGPCTCSGKLWIPQDVQDVLDRYKELNS